MGILSRFRAPNAGPLQPVPLSAIKLDYRLTIRGESHCLPELYELKQRSDQWPARLVRDRRNRYDPNAIAVEIDGRVVGWIAAPQAVTVAPQLDELASRGCVVEFLADLVGGDGNRRSIGVFSAD